MSINVKLAKRDPIPLSLRGRAGEGETGMAGFIIGDCIHAR